MCGLAAILAQDGAPPVDAEELLRIRERMIARGPDGAGLWLGAEGRIGLAHRRLAIIDLAESGAQPMASDDGRLVIVFNGEIYNFRELRAELEAQGVQFRSHSDTEVILALYARDGIAMLPRLRGMFALALWDKTGGGLLLARDGFGIKPLYIADDGKTLRAASQVKALLAGGGIATRADPAGHAGFFLWGHVPEPHTLYKGIRALPAGSWLWAGRDGQRRQGRHFDLPGELAAARPGPGDLCAALTDSVRHHLIADVPVGVFLSSGRDSTLLAALAARASDQPLRTLTLGFDEFAGTAKDEVPLAEAVARHYGCRHTTMRITKALFTDLQARILADMDQPSVDGVNTWLVARAARQAGLKVALSGLGGDELFAGYDTFTRLPRMVGALKPLAPLSPSLGRMARMALAPWIGRFASPKLAGLLELGTGWGGGYLLSRGLFMPWDLPRLIGPEMAREGWETLSAAPPFATSVLPADERLKIQALESAFYMRNQLLRDADWAGMAHSLEIRTPLVDTNLLGALAPLLAGAQPPGKHDMAACATPPLPEEILARPKTGFFVPMAEWLGQPDLRGWARFVHGAFAGTGVGHA